MSVTPMDLRNYTVPELRAELRRRHERGFDNGIEPNADGTYGLPKAISRMRKAELIDAVVKAAKAQERQEREEQPAEIGTALHKAIEDMADVDPDDIGEDTVGRLMREATERRLAERADVELVDGVITEELGDLAPTLSGLATGMADAVEALNTAGLVAQEAARKLARVAWAHQVAVIRSMGHTVRGKVVDTVLREPGADGTGRVCLVVEHPNGTPSRKATRTLHALADVEFEALAG